MVAFMVADRESVLATAAMLHDQISRSVTAVPLLIDRLTSRHAVTSTITRRRWSDTVIITMCSQLTTTGIVVATVSGTKQDAGDLTIGRVD